MGLPRRLFAALQQGMAKKNNAADRPSPAIHRPQRVMQRLAWYRPVSRGLEIKISDKLSELKNKNHQKN
ncbi:MAG: hypothetical protein EAZ34_01010 [Polaromonas sp.]|nr:MAG: hypothetical protein EAZ34_01010 [Polaromonas sp.]